ncbi:MAG: PAS domain S-box protein [Anaerolineaceae bacterium]|nr:PAS domain S-box protein [Anaerolineaceae bacterium]
MNFLDIRTVLFGQTITDALCTVVLVFLWLQNQKRYAGILFWAVDFCLQTTAALLVILRGSIPDWISLGLSTPLIITGAFLGYLGLERFVGKRTAQPHNYVLLGVFTLVHLYFVYARLDLDARNLNMSAGLFVFSAQCAWLMLKRVGGHRSSMMQAVGWIFSMFCLVSAIRIFILIANPQPTNDFFQSGLYDTLILISFQILLILLTFGLALLVNRRLLVDVKTQEEKFTRAFHSSPYAILISQFSDGLILDVNRNFEEMTGYQAEEAVGKTTLNLPLWVNPEDRQHALAELLDRGEVQGRQFQFKVKSGRIITGLYYAEILGVDNERLVLSSIRDITEDKQVEEKLQSSERTLKLFVEYAPAAIAMFDRQMNYLAASRRFLTDYRLKETNIVGRCHYDIFPEIPERWKEIHRRCLTGAVEHAEEDAFPRSDGSLDWVRWEIHPWYEKPGEIGGLLLFSELVNERKQAEQELQFRNVLLTNQQEASIDGILVVDDKSNILTYNQRFVDMWNIPAKMIEARDDAPVLQLVTTQVTNPEAFQAQVEYLNKQRRETSRHELVLKDGRVFERYSTPMWTPGEEYLGRVWYFRDITERTRAEQALRESEASYRSLFENMLNGFAYCQIILEGEHAVDFVYLKVNRAFETLTGLIGVEGKPASVAIPGIRQSDPELIETYGRVALTGKPEIFETYVQALQMWFAISVYCPQKGCFVAVFDVITKRKLAEQKLREDEARLHLALDAAKGGVWEWNLETNENIWSEELWKVYGLEPHCCKESYEVWLETVHPDDRQKAEEAVQKAAREGSEIYAEWRVREGDGTERWLMSRGQPILSSTGRAERYIGTVLDITDRKQAEQSLRDSEEKFRKAFLTSPDSININRLADGMYVSINAGFSQIMGYSAEEVTGKTSLELNIWANPQDRKALVEGLTKNGEVLNFEAPYRAKNGEIHQGLMSASVFELDNIPHIISITRDITGRKRAEELLRLSEERYRTVADYTHDWEYWLGPDRKMLYVSPSCERITGYRYDEFTADANLLDKIVHPEDRIVYQEHKSTADRNEDDQNVHEVDFRIVRRDGQVRWIGHTCRLIRRADGTSLGRRATNRDITESKLAAEAMRQSQESFVKVFQSNPSAMTISRLADGKFLTLNQAYTEIMGYTPPEIVGRTPAELDIYVHPEERQEIMQRLIEHGSIHNCEQQVHTQSGEERMIDISMESIPFNNEECILSAFLDITERKRAEKMLQESEERYRATFDLTALGIAHLGLDGRWLRVNQKLCDIIGYSRAELLEMTFQDITHPDDLDADLEYVRQVLAGEISNYSMEKRYYHKDGSIIWIDLTVALARGSAGEPEYFISVVDDISERKQIEEEIRRLNDSLEQRVIERTAQLEVSNKELESFAYSVSHDLRAPLRGINGWSLALMEDNYEQLDQQGRQYLERVRSEAERMGQLIDDLLQLSRVTRADMQTSPVDLSALAQTVINRLQAAQPQRQVEVVIQPGLMTRGDATLLGVVLTNLFENAWKFTGKCSQARIEFGKERVDGQQAFFVRDNGVGFDMQYAQKLFGAFQRLHKISEFPGTGIGLATVQRIIHRHGGKVWADAQVNSGATFFFTLEEAA